MKLENLLSFVKDGHTVSGLIYSTYAGTWRNVMFTKVVYSEDALMFFFELLLRDKRDLSTYRAPFIGSDRNGKMFMSAFGHTIDRWARRTFGVSSRNEMPVYFTPSASLEMVKNIARRLWLDLDTDLSRTLYDLSCIDDESSWKMILSAKVNPSLPCYTGNSDLFMRDYQAISFLRKYEGFSFDESPYLTSLQKWIDCEKQCGETNHIFRNGYTWFSRSEKLDIAAVQKTIMRILGSAPSVTEIISKSRIGPGATLSSPSKFCSILDKIDQDEPKVTPGCLPLAKRLMEHPIFKSSFKGSESLVVSPYSDLLFIPKKWDEYRPIEPPVDINMILQLGLASNIRSKLKRFGLDLDTQANRNGSLAYRGSKDQSICTTDLSSASDTISYHVVKTLLPPSWFNLLNQMRTTHVRVFNEDRSEQHVHRLEKFSAMGNGFTFELESLIFLAIVLVGCNLHHEKRMDSEIGVFGDDLCYPTKFDSNVKRLLTLFGFKVNYDKSFNSGPFRESCGSDFYMGATVRPYFLKKVIEDASQIISVANGIRWASVRSMLYYASDIRYRNVWLFIVHLVPREYRVCGPKELGDSVIWANPDDGIEAEWPISLNGIWSYRAKHGPFTGIQRGINISAYLPTSPTAAWQLVKDGFATTQQYRKDISIFSIPSVVNLSTSIQVANTCSITPEESSLLPRTFRKDSSYRLKFRRSDRFVSVRCDTPPFR